MAAACSSEGAERREARRFLAGYTAVAEAVGEQARRTRLKQLKELPLHGETASQARDLCVRAHTALLDAEAEQARAEGMFEKLLEGAGGKPLDPAGMAPVQAGIERSEKALKDARGHYRQCEEAARGLAVRFGER